MRLHHGKHHKAYVEALQRIEAAHPGSISAYSLRELVVLLWTANADARVAFQNAAQHYNHCIQWLSLCAKGGGQPPKIVEDALTENFGGVPQFQQAWMDKATSLFGSGWIWLVHDVRTGRLEILPTSNAETPITTPGLTVLGNIDVWEHAYYVDYPAARKAYVQAVMDKLFDWHFVESQLLRARQLEKPDHA
jgi:Fe-Mn family superoxide dismutase